MSNQNFDDFVKNEFSTYTPDVPPHIWDNIAALRKKKKRPAFWLSFLNSRNILLLLALLTAGGGAAWWFSDHQNNTKDKITATDNKDQSVNKTNTAESAKDNNLTTPDQQAASNSSAVQPSDNSTITTSDNTNNKNIHTSSTGTAQQVVPVTGSIYSPLPLLPPVQPVTAKIKSGRSRMQGSSSHISKAGNDADYLQEEATLAADAGAISLPVAGTMLARLQYAVEKMNGRSKKNLPLFDQQIPKTTNPKCPRVDDPAGDKQYFELYAGPDVAMRSITDSGNTAYLQQRKESEKFSSAFSAGARYTKVFGNGVSLRTGINYSQINEKFTYSKGGIIQYVYILDQATGDTIGSYTISGSRYKTTYNRYRSIDIPLQLGYEMGNGRLHANLGAGIMVNIYSWQKGDVLDTSLQPVSITTGKSSSPYGFKTNTGFGFLASASLYYKLTDRLHLMAEPYFKYSIKPMSKENLTLTQKYSTAGLRFGVRFDMK
ncbi:MAG: hypothetical protein ABJA78_07920 [Ferruginibacter sp.]